MSELITLSKDGWKCKCPATDEATLARLKDEGFKIVGDNAPVAAAEPAPPQPPAPTTAPSPPPVVRPSAASST